MPLTKKEEKILVLLEEIETHPEQIVEHTSPPGVFGILSEKIRHGSDWARKPKGLRQEKLTELRAHKKVYEEGGNPDENFKRYYEILEEEKNKLN